MADVFQCIPGGHHVFNQFHIDLAADGCDLGRIAATHGGFDSIEVKSGQPLNVGHRLVAVPAPVGIDLDARVGSGRLPHHGQSLFVQVDVDTDFQLERRESLGTLLGDFVPQQLQVVANEGDPGDVDSVSPLSAEQTADREVRGLARQVVAGHVEAGPGQAVQ